VNRGNATGARAASAGWPSTGGGNWLYFDVHGLVRIRVEAGHPSERSVRLVFGPFQTDGQDSADLTLQYRVPEMGEHSFASESYLFGDGHVYLKDYRLHLMRTGEQFTLASRRDLLPFVPPVVQTLLLRRQHCLVHSAAVAVGERGVLLPGWGGTGKTSAIICLLKQLPEAAFMSDDYAIVSEDGRVLSFPKAFFIYPYHRGLFPHLFQARHKPLVPVWLSGMLERLRTVVRPTIMAFPRLENLARRFTPEHMQVPARTALPDARFVEIAGIDQVLFVERYSGGQARLDELAPAEVTRRLMGNWYYEQGRCARDLLLGAAGVGVLDYESYFGGMARVLRSALGGRKVYRLRMGQMSPGQTGQAVIDAVREILRG